MGEALIDLEALNQNLSLPDLSDNFYQSFKVRRLRNSRLLWLDEAYFFKLGYNVFDKEVFTKISNYLLDNFGVMSTANQELAKHMIGKEKTLYADRYGASGISFHGGSGRCGTLRSYNAKGIGITPLVSSESDFWHKSGLLWLSHCIREVIHGAIADGELPYGGVPVVAIIDTGIDVKPMSYSPKAERCGIVVRPNFIRHSHFERAMYFGSAGFINSDQEIDARRTKEAVKSANKRIVRNEFPKLEEIYIRASSQVGAARALRLWHGEFISQNVAVDGALIDHGSFRSVADWRRTLGQNKQVFGREEVQLKIAAKSLWFMFKKYSGNLGGIPDLKLLHDIVDRQTKVAFIEYVLKGLGISHDKNSDNLEKLINDYYALQQRELALPDNKNDNPLPWIYQFFEDNVPENPRLITSLSKNQQAALALYNEITSNKDFKISQNRAKNWFYPRSELTTFTARKISRNAADSLTGKLEKDCLNVSETISRQIAINRRYWKFLPNEMYPIAQTNYKGNNLVWAKNEKSDGEFLYIEAPRFEDNVLILGKKYNLKSLDSIVQYKSENLIIIKLDFMQKKIVKNSIEIGSDIIASPERMFTYQ